MAKKVDAYIQLQIPAVKATPAPPVGPALGQHGVNIAQFTKEFNAKTQGQEGMIIPVVITVYADRSFSFVTKTPPAAVLLKKACKIQSGSGEPNKKKVATISKEELQKILTQNFVLFSKELEEKGIQICENSVKIHVYKNSASAAGTLYLNQKITETADTEILTMERNEQDESNGTGG